MFDMTVPNSKGNNSKKSPATPFSIQLQEGGGYAKDAWFREEELMRKKLEKGAISQLKSRIAQQNRQAGNKNSAPMAAVE